MKGLTLLLPVLVALALAAGYALEHHGPEPAPFPELRPPQGLQFDPMENVRGPEALEGRVLDHRGQPVPDAEVYLRDDKGPRWSRTDGFGAFRLAGLTETDATREVLVVRWGFRAETFDVSPGTAYQNLTLSRPMKALPSLPKLPRAPLVGRVRSALHSEFEGFEVVFRPVASVDDLTAPILRRVPVAADGSFAAEDLILGAYELEVLPDWARGGSWPNLIASEARELLHDGESTREIEIELAAGVIAGRLVDTRDTPLEGALVLVSRSPAPGEPDRVWPPAVSDDEGQFRVDDLPPGSYELAHRAGAFVGETVLVEVEAAQILDPGLAAIEP